MEGFYRFKSAFVIKTAVSKCGVPWTKSNGPIFCTRYFAKRHWFSERGISSVPQKICRIRSGLRRARAAITPESTPFLGGSKSITSGDCDLGILFSTNEASIFPARKRDFCRFKKRAEFLAYSIDAPSHSTPNVELAFSPIKIEQIRFRTRLQ